MKNIFRVFLGVLLLSLVACGKKESRVGARPQAKKTQGEPKPQKDQGKDHSGDHHEVPGGIEGPERIGPSGPPSGRPGSRGPVTPKDSKEKDPTPAPRSGGTPKGDLPPLETPRQEKRPSTSHGGDLPSAPRTTPSPEFGRDKRPAPSAAPLPWYPPNLEGSPGEAWLFHNIDPLLKHLERSGPRAIRHEKRLSMTLALGYFDGYQSNPLTYDMINYGQHAPVDPFLRAAVHEALTRPCRGLLQVCGFEVLRNDDISTIYRKTDNDGIIQELRVISGALTERHSINTGSRSAEQLRRSQKTEELFLKAFTDSDLVVYVGHSRNGGGPDFHPPKLVGNKVNYPYYEKNRPGLNKMLSALKGGKLKVRNLAILSCDSRQWFLAPLDRVAPQVQILTVAGQHYSEDLTADGLAAIDHFLRLGTLRGFRFQ